MKPSRLLLIGLVPALLLVSACEKTDTDLVMDFMNTWLESRGMVEKDPKTGKYSPTVSAIPVALGATSTGDPQIDAAVQGGKMVKDIAATDKIIDDAKKDLEADPPKKKEAKDKLDVAVNSRPTDWYYRNNRGAYLLANGDVNGATKDFEAGVKACNNNYICLNALYDNREQLLEKLRSDQSKTGPAPCATLRMLHHTYDLHLPLTTGNDFQRLGTALGPIKHDMSLGNCF